MNFKILKKDFKRKKSTNIILLIFVILSSMFISSSIKNMTVILGGLDNFIEKAKLADYIFLTMREKYEEKDDNDRYIEEFLAENRDTYQTCEKDDILYLAKKNVIMPDGDPISNSNTMIINSISIKQQEFFDENNEIIDTLEDGKILMPLSIMKSENLSKMAIVVRPSTSRRQTSRRRSRINAELSMPSGIFVQKTPASAATNYG